jgi:hypothetical protein
MKIVSLYTRSTFDINKEKKNSKKYPRQSYSVLSPFNLIIGLVGYDLLQDKDRMVYELLGYGVEMAKSAYVMCKCKKWWLFVSASLNGEANQDFMICSVTELVVATMHFDALNRLQQ